MTQIVGFPDANAEIVRYEAGQDPCWDFGQFAIGINRPRGINQFAAHLAMRQADAPSAPAVPSLEPPAERKGPAGGVHIGSIDAFPEGEIHRIEIDSLGAVAIIQQEQRFFAVNDRCSHAEASLSEGITEHGRIVCPVLAATQVFEQIGTEIKAAVLGATAIKIVGPVSFSDANSIRIRPTACLAAGQACPWLHAALVWRCLRPGYQSPRRCSTSRLANCSTPPPAAGA